MNEIEQTLDKLIEHINSELKASPLVSTQDDGRTDSAIQESIISDLAKDFADLEENENIRFNNSKIRDWTDIELEITENNQKLFVPINIKITNFNGSADNISSKEGLYYALTGVLPDKINRWDKYMAALKENMSDDVSITKDYYLLVIDKNNEKTYWTSLRRLLPSEIVINGNNLPFQVKYSGQKLPTPRNNSEMKKLYLSVLDQALKSRSDAYLEYLKNFGSDFEIDSFIKELQNIRTQRHTKQIDFDFEEQK